MGIHTSISVSNWEGRDKDIPMPVGVFKGKPAHDPEETFMTVKIGPVTYHFSDDESLPDLVHRLSVAYLEALTDFNEREGIDHPLDEPTQAAS